VRDSNCLSSLFIKGLELKRLKPTRRRAADGVPVPRAAVRPEAEAAQGGSKQVRCVWTAAPVADWSVAGRSVDGCQAAAAAVAEVQEPVETPASLAITALGHSEVE